MRGRKLKQGQRIYLWNQLGNRLSHEREYVVAYAGVGVYTLTDIMTGKPRLIADSYPDLFDKELQVMEKLDGLVSK